MMQVGRKNGSIGHGVRGNEKKTPTVGLSAWWEKKGQKWEGQRILEKSFLKNKNQLKKTGTKTQSRETRTGGEGKTTGERHWL